MPEVILVQEMEAVNQFYKPSWLSKFLGRCHSDTPSLGIIWLPVYSVVKISATGEVVEEDYEVVDQLVFDEVVTKSFLHIEQEILNIVLVSHTSLWQIGRELHIVIR